MSKNHTDVIITRVTDLFVAGMSVKLLPKSVKRPRVIVRHGLPMRYKVKKHLLLHRKLANGIIANANSTRDEYIGKGYFPKEFVTVVHNGTETPEKVTPYDFSRHFPGKRIILSAGRLARQKGYEHLIDAIALLPKSADDLVFVVLGAGKKLKSLQRRAAIQNISHRIHFWGFVDDINPYLAGCDLFVLPSLYEGMPNAVMETMAAGKAVIACNVNGLPELVHHNEHGLLIPPGDPHALVQAITHLTDNPHLRRQMGQNAAQHIARSFSTTRMIDRLEKAVELSYRRDFHTPA